MKIYIYALIHPETNEIRYIGKTGNIKNRYNSHLSVSRKLKTHLGAWIKSLSYKGLLPKIVIIEECTSSNWKEREIYHISQHDNLVNHLKGGNEPPIVKANIKKFSKSGDKYRVRCSYNNTVYYLGTFDTKEQAESVYDDFQINPIKYIQSYKSKHNRSGVHMYKDNTLIQSFSSISECANHLNTSVSNISRVCKGKAKTHKGYTFKYKILHSEGNPPQL